MISAVTIWRQCGIILLAGPVIRHRMLVTKDKAR